MQTVSQEDYACPTRAVYMRRYIEFFRFLVFSSEAVRDARIGTPPPNLLRSSQGIIMIKLDQNAEIYENALIKVGLGHGAIIVSLRRHSTPL